MPIPGHTEAVTAPSPALRLRDRRRAGPAAHAYHSQPSSRALCGED
jgi:hypothetical protein